MQEDEMAQQDKPAAAKPVVAIMPKVVTATVAARLVGLSESTLAKLRLNGNGPIYVKLGRRVLYRPADLEQWLESRTARDTSDADARFLKALTIAHPR
jgi:predicted DNA-binding transcriptional regulator AlpA